MPRIISLSREFKRVQKLSSVMTGYIKLTWIYSCFFGVKSIYSTRLGNYNRTSWVFGNMWQKYPVSCTQLFRCRKVQICYTNIFDGLQYWLNFVATSHLQNLFTVQVIFTRSTWRAFISYLVLMLIRMAMLGFGSCVVFQCRVLVCGDWFLQCH